MSSPFGFVDLQVNGHKGIHFSSPTLTLDQIRIATLELDRIGTVAFCPTIVTGPLSVFERNLALFATAMQEPDLKPHLLGLHLEGPFISPKEGARGAHPLEHIRAPSVEIFKQFQAWSGGHISILTLAPEEEGALDLIRYASRQGTVVSLGHHLAEDDAMARAVDAGARLCTHLGNGMPGTISRHQNPLWWQLAEDRLTGMFITDGHHIPADYIKVALRAKTLDRALVVSDATDLAGMPPGRYDFQGTYVILASNGRISFGDTPYLAGASATLTQCMNHLASLDLLTEAELWKLGYHNPLRMLGLAAKGFTPGVQTRVGFKKGKFELTAGDRAG